MLFASSSLKIRDDGTHFAGHTLPLFLVNCSLYFQPNPRKLGYSEPSCLLFFTRVATSSCGKKLTIFSQSHPWVARWPTWEVHPLRHSTAVAWPGALVEKRHRRTSTGDGGRGVKATATGTATHKHGAHSSPLPDSRQSPLPSRGGSCCILVTSTGTICTLLCVLITLLMACPLATRTGTGALMGSHLSLAEAILQPQGADSMCRPQGGS